MTSMRIRTMAIVLAGAALAGPPAAGAAPADNHTVLNPASVPPPPSLMAVSAADGYARLRAPHPPLPHSASGGFDLPRDRAADRTAPVSVVRASTAHSDSGGFDVPSAAIGAAAAGLIAALLISGAMTRRRTA